MIGAFVGSLIEASVKITEVDRFFSPCLRVKLTEEQRLELLDVEKILDKSLQEQLQSKSYVKKCNTNNSPNNVNHYSIWLANDVKNAFRRLSINLGEIYKC